MPVISFRAPIDVSRVRVGTTYGEAGGDLGKTTAPPGTPPPPPGLPPKSSAPEESTFMQSAHAIGGYAFPVEVSVATVAGGAVGLFFGGWFWGALGAIGSNLAGRLGATAYCKRTPNPAPGSYATGKCGSVPKEPTGP